MFTFHCVYIQQILINLTSNDKDGDMNEATGYVLLGQEFSDEYYNRGDG